MYVPNKDEYTDVRRRRLFVECCAVEGVVGSGLYRQAASTCTLFRGLTRDCRDEAGEWVSTNKPSGGVAAAAFPYSPGVYVHCKPLPL